ncbi:MAG: hypothetical protein M3Y27_15140 [Acidobacteriota bacterium]|nr:hypothetical protein [Acidobacteriota bacterium]
MTYSRATDLMQTTRDLTSVLCDYGSHDSSRRDSRGLSSRIKRFTAANCMDFNESQLRFAGFCF